MAETPNVAKAPSPTPVEDNGVLYVSKRISSNHKVTVPLRKRKSIKEEPRSEDSQGAPSAFAPPENSDAVKQADVVNSECNLRDILSRDSSLCYSMQSGSRGMGNYSYSATNQRNKFSATSNPAFKKMGYGYSNIKNYHDFFNSNARMNQGHSENANKAFSQNSMPMPLYYYYNNPYLISQIVKELQITIQNVLLKNATIYSGYDTGISNSLEIHNPSDGSVVLIQFRGQNFLENSFMDFGINQMKSGSFGETSASALDTSAPTDEILLPINNFEIIETVPMPCVDDKPPDKDVKPCFVKLNKMTDDDATMTEILPVEVTYSDDNDSVLSDSHSSPFEGETENKCNKCGLTFKLKIQLAHHKCAIENVVGEHVDQAETDEKSQSMQHVNGSLEEEIKEEVSVTSYVNNNNFSGVTIYQVSVPEQLHELSQFSCPMKCDVCGSEIGADDDFCTTCENRQPNSEGGGATMASCDGDEHDEHPEFTNGKPDVQSYKECPFCKKRFSPYYSLKYHTSKCRSMHVSRQKSAKSHLSMREIISERSGNVISCKLCNKTFSNNNKLRRHMIIHSGVKRYICNQCGKRFGRSDHLKLHKETHSGLKPFVCGSCEKAFTSRQSLKLHQRLHNGEAPYMCNFCRKTFVQLASLKTHLKVHCKSKVNKNKLATKT